MQVTTIYVMPTETGLPPRALLGMVERGEDEEGPITPEEMAESAEAMAIWTGDQGCWTLHGEPLEPEFSEAISAHAHSLGVPGF
jgi:hypothetical protein